jgi:uncharacterized protein YcbK (DUF882 family)
LNIDNLLFKNDFNRRLFLKASICTLSSLFCGPVFSEATKQLPEGKLTLLNIHTNDRLSVTYRKPSGEYDAEALKALDWVLRCHYSGQAIAMDKDMIEIVNIVDKKFGGNNEIHVISGYRSPEYNHLLLNEGRHVAKGSLHLVGKAIDIRIPGVDLAHLRDVALDLKLGGVGYYKSAFVHLDSGRVRTW